MIGRAKTVTVIVVEGVGFSRLEKLCQGSRLPGFERLLSQSLHGPLRARGVPYEAPILASAWTGVSPGHHGCFSYWHVHAPDTRPRIFDPHELRVAPLWESKELADRRFVLLNLFGSDPSRPSRHKLIGYPFRQTIAGCQPRTLLSSLTRRGIRYLHDVMAFYRGESLAEFLQLLVRVEENRIRTAEVLAEEEYDVFIANFTIADRVGHFYEHELADDETMSERSATFIAYRLLDDLIGKLADADGDVIVFSEFGFEPLREFVSFNDVLAEASLFARPSIPDRSFDAAQTMAFEAVQGTHGINVNLSGRYEEGVVNPSDYDRVRADVRSALLEARHPETGQKLLHDVLMREEIHDGPALESAPDLVLVPADQRYLPRGDPFWANHVNRRFQTGWHCADGFWIGRGPSFRGTAGAKHTAEPEDIAATIFDLSGRDPPGGTRGVSLRR